MYYLIYKTTNKINRKIYIGQHKTTNKDDGYLGSGKLLINAINKYGEENFSFEILHECENKDEMCALEKKYVNEEFINRDDTYNIKEGGTGGFDHINRNQKTKEKNNIKRKITMKNKTKEEMIEINKKKVRHGKNNGMYGRHRYGKENPMWGKTHNDEVKEKMRNKRLGTVASDETKEKQRQSQIKRWDSVEKRKKQSEILKEAYDNPEMREKMSKITKGKLWFNNGEKCIRAYESPGSEWRRGRLPFKKNA